MATSEPTGPEAGSLAERLRRPVQVIVVSSIMLTFISYWRTAAIVLADLASTSYYIGGIVEMAIGPAAPFFILGVMLFSYAVRSVYIESSTLFVRGGVYRVVKRAMGGFLAKLAVSALMFDYILTGPTSAVSAGQYIMGLLADTLAHLNPHFQLAGETGEVFRNWGAVAIACAITLYFFRLNVIGLHESSGKALKIVGITTVMVVVMLVWCGLTLWLRGGPVNPLRYTPQLQPKVEYEVTRVPDRITGQTRAMWKRDPSSGELVVAKERGLDGQLRAVPSLNPATGRQEDPLGWISHGLPGLAERLRAPGRWLSLVGLIGLMLAFGHSILAMSGEETLAQVYREVESPKLKNFKRAALIIFLYSLLMTACISFLAVMLIPDEVRMKDYAGNLIGGLAMYVAGPPVARLLLNAFVVVVGFLILSGAVNTAILGSNSVLNRVAEDGVLPDWFLRPHPRYGTTYRLLRLILVLQLAAILVSRGNVYVLGEAYAFGVVWSFAFMSAAMVMLRFKDRSPREFKVPFNLRLGEREIPLGLVAVFLILALTALGNFFTKEVATIGGLSFTLVFFTVFTLSERYHERKRGEAAHQHVEQFNEQPAADIGVEQLQLQRPYRKLVAIRSTQNLTMLEKALQETDPDTTDVVVMTANRIPQGTAWSGRLDRYGQELMTAVVDRAEKAGKPVRPLIVPTNNPLFAVLTTSRKLRAQEVVLGASNVYTADVQLEQIAFYWINLCGGTPEPLTIHVIGPDRDVVFDLGGGNRIPTLGDRLARSVADLRQAGIGVRRVLLVHFHTSQSSDLFAATLTMLDPQVTLAVASIAAPSEDRDARWLELDLERAGQLHREVVVHLLRAPDPGRELAELVRREKYDLLVVPRLAELPSGRPPPLDVDELFRHPPCRMSLVSPPAIPGEL